jgi:hypothetical protein
MASLKAKVPVSFRVASGPTTLNGSVLSLTGNGPIVVRVSQVGNGYYNSASEGNLSFTTKKRMQHIIFSPIENKRFEDAPFTLSATLNRST